jgi:hypothetical protein
MIVLVPKSNSYTSPIVPKIFMSFLAILLLIVLIRIPIHFYKLIGLIKKEFIFELESIRLLRWLGLELWIVYFGCLLGICIDHKINCSLFSFSKYEIMSGSVDPIWLLLGIIAFLIAEIFYKAMVLKEEQELTI